MKNKILVLGGAGLVGGAFVYKALNSRLAKNLDEIVLTNFSRNKGDLVNSFEETLNKFELYGYKTERIDELTWKGPNEIIISGRDFDLIPKELKDKNKIINPRETPLYDLVKEIKPKTIFNNIPTATAVSYGTNGENKPPLLVLMEYLDSLHRALVDFDVKNYVKIGTTGVGGMGYNIPFSHGEGGRPSLSLKLKNAIALTESAQYDLWSKDLTFSTRLIELKPGVALGFDRVDNDKIKPLHRTKNLPKEVKSVLEKENAIIVCEPVELTVGENKNKEIEWGKRIIGPLKAPYLRSGENGQFSRSEWLTLTRPGMMELLSGEDVAEIAIRELNGINTGYNYIITKEEIKPRFSSASIRDLGAKILDDIGGKYSCPIFLNLGPERLSKLVSEAYIIRESLKSKGFKGTIDEIEKIPINSLREAVIDYVNNENQVIKEIVSVGIPIYTGEKLITGPYVAMPDRQVSNYSDLNDILKNQKLIDYNCMYCWVDLREKKSSLKLDEPKGVVMYSGLEAWKSRASEIAKESRFVRNLKENKYLGSMIGKSALWLPYLREDKELDIEPGEITGWIFENEELGGRY